VADPSQYRTASKQRARLDSLGSASKHAREAACRLPSLSTRNVSLAAAHNRARSRLIRLLPVDQAGALSHWSWLKMNSLRPAGNVAKAGQRGCAAAELRHSSMNCHGRPQAQSRSAGHKFVKDPIRFAIELRRFGPLEPSGCLSAGRLRRLLHWSAMLVLTLELSSSSMQPRSLTGEPSSPAEPDAFSEAKDEELWRDARHHWSA
jgi:hypothetical protein